MLNDEINSLKNDITTNSASLKKLTETAHQHWFVVQDMNKKTQKKEMKAKKASDYYNELEEKRNNLKSSIQEELEIIATTLDNILYKEKSLISTGKNIENLDNRISEESENLKKKTETIQELEIKRQELLNQIQMQEDEIEKMNKENSDIVSFLSHILKYNDTSNQKTTEFDDPVRLTERFISSLRHRRDAST